MSVITKCFAVICLTFYCNPIAAQEWPTRQVTIISPFQAGSTPDSVARILADRMQQRLGKTFVVENRPGASGNTGTGMVAKAVPDGHTLGVSIVGPLVINALLFPKMPYETAKDIEPITILASQPSVLTINPSMAADDVATLIAILKRAPDKFNYGSIGRGSLSHLAMESIATKAAVRPVHVPYAGSPAAVTALLRGDVQISVLPAGAVAQQAAEGKLRMLAVTSARRSALLPQLPTLAEAGIANVEADAWIGLIAPAGVSPPIITKIREIAIAVLAEPEVVEKLKLQFMTPVANTTEEFRTVLKEEHDRWAPIIAANGIKAE
ncbi:tripartite tricarboxylate transporter substrate binding protein [Tardiphaga sp. 42S5]|uniref:Bug family tripartite tricarboxylate transporter substrate binding protein n=1 Tax=Tardiphaga sp. 42S5 TaxID=1404799 RepID=UPI002A5A7526|nr:tripartite tricarboxylate transporter substrate binding protein [Tardiphaga sp. 42S5]WPO43255.1 tripartite tricarboxylate transporter substrate binding protein [Tardiphaga sp. 42S5]